MNKPFDIEARGVAEGINPMFGEWRQKFELEPVSYANIGTARQGFKQAIRGALKNKFVFVGEVSVVATLYLDEQKMLETPAYGDLDNYAKQLLDSIKGQGGLLIDDCQVRHLDISWIDIPYGSWFELEIKAHPDDFLPNSLKLFEMPDGLFYPISDQVWATTGLINASNDSVLYSANSLAKITKNKKTFRHELRQKGVPAFEAFRHAKLVSPGLLGFHRSRVIDSGYELISKNEWSGAAN